MLTFKKDRAGEWRWSLTSSSDTIADSGEGYHNLTDCMAGALGALVQLAQAARELATGPEDGHDDEDALNDPAGYFGDHVTVVRRP